MPILAAYRLAACALAIAYSYSPLLHALSFFHALTHCVDLHKHPPPSPRSCPSLALLPFYAGHQNIGSYGRAAAFVEGSVNSLNFGYAL